MFLLTSGLWLAMLQAGNTGAGYPMQVDARTGAILVRVWVNGNAGTFILDTGASHTMVDLRLVGVSVPELRAARIDTHRGYGVDADVVWKTVQLQIAGNNWQQERVEIVDLSGLQSIYHTRIDGLIGQDVLMRFRSVELDFKHSSLTLAR